MQKIEKNWWRINADWQVNIRMFSWTFYKFKNMQFGNEIWIETPEHEVPWMIRKMATNIEYEI